MQKTRIFLILFILIVKSCLLFSVSIDTLMHQTKTTSGVDLLHTYNQITKYYYYTERDSSYKYAKKALLLLKKFPNKKEAIETYNFTGMIVSNIGLYEEGFNYLFKALKISEEIKDTFQISRLNNNIGVSYMQIKEYEDAEKFLKKAVEYKNSKSVRIGPVYNNLGLIKEMQGKNKEALKYFNLSYKHYVLDKDTTGIATALGNIGGLKVRTGYENEGYKDLLLSLKYCKKLNDEYRIAVIYNKIGLDYFYSTKQNYDSAKIYIEKSMQVTQQNNVPELLISNYYSLSLIYNSLHDFRTALKYKEKAINLKDSLYTLDLKSKIKDIDIRYQDLKKRKKIELLKKETQINEIREKSQKVWIYILISVGILFLIAVIIIYKYKITQDSINEQIVSKNIEIVEQEEKINEKENIRNNDQKYKHSNLEETEENIIAEKIEKVFKEEKIYKNPDLTIVKLSEHLNVNRTYVSQVINNYFKKNFNNFINEYRIKEARKLLLNNNNYSIEGVSREVGFRSKSVFNSSFKKYIGVTPSVFIENFKKSKQI